MNLEIDYCPYCNKFTYLEKYSDYSISSLISPNVSNNTLSPAKGINPGIQAINEFLSPILTPLTDY